MSKYYYFNTIRKTIVQFLDLFNDINIARYDENGEFVKYIKVPLTFAPKSKIWYFQTKRDVQVFPIIGIQLTGVEYDENRQTQHNVKVPAVVEDGEIVYFDNPSPYKFQFSVEIVSKYMTDNTQIIEQILPFFDPTNTVRITVPELGISADGLNDPLELKVTYNGVSVEEPVDISEEEFRTINWVLDFSVNGYLFKPLARNKEVHSVVDKIYLSDDGFDNRSNTDTISGNNSSTTLFISGGYDEDLNVIYTYERFGN